MASTPAQLQAAVAAAETALAAADLATLKAFQTQLTTGNISINTFVSELTNAATALGDPGRQAEAQALLYAWNTNIVGQVATMISEATAASGG